MCLYHWKKIGWERRSQPTERLVFGRSSLTLILSRRSWTITCWNLMSSLVFGLRWLSLVLSLMSLLCPTSWFENLIFLRFLKISLMISSQRSLPERIILEVIQIVPMSHRRRSRLRRASTLQEERTELERLEFVNLVVLVVVLLLPLFFFSYGQSVWPFWAYSEFRLSVHLSLRYHVFIIRVFHNAFSVYMFMGLFLVNPGTLFLTLVQFFLWDRR